MTAAGAVRHGRPIETPSEQRPGGARAGLVLAGAVLLAGAPLLAGRVIKGHDADSFLFYAQQAAANLREGIVLPAWAADLNGGMGGPGLVLYPPLTSGIHALVPFLGGTLATGIGFAALAGLLLGGLAMLGFLRSRGVGTGPALAASLAYTVAPYRMIDLYERAAFAEHWSFVFVPLVLWAGSEERLPWRRRVGLAALAIAAFALTNLPFLILFGLTLGVAVVFDPSLRRSLGTLSAAAPIGVALAAFALVPQALSGSLCRTELWYGEKAGAYFRPSSNGLFSDAALDVAFNHRVSGVLVTTVLVGLAAFVLSSAEARRSRSTWTWLAILAACLVLALPRIGPLWDGTPVIAKVQFPWRCAGPATLAAALLVANLAPRRAFALAALAALAAAPHVGARTVPAPARQPAPVVAPGTHPLPDPRALFEAWGVGGDWVQRGFWDYWFIPRTAPIETFAEMTGGRSPKLDPIRGRPALLAVSPATPVEVVRWNRLDREVVVDAPRPGPLLWHVLAFPGTSVSVDGKDAPTLLDGATGLAAVDVPAGRHRVGWRWRPFGPLVPARWLSGLALAAVALLIAWPSRRRAQGPAPPEPVSPAGPRG